MKKILLSRTSDDRILSLAHDDVLKLYEIADLDPQIRLGYRKGDAFKCLFETPKGAQYTLILGDSHAFWKSHQDGEGLAYFERALNHLEDGDAFELEVVEVTYFNPQEISSEEDVVIDF